jgi:geranylgeranyl pyrophosphate synthase
VLLAWERATPADRAILEELVQGWSPVAMRRVSELLARYDTLAPTLEIIGEHLARARQTLRGLPDSDGRTGLLGLTEFLARQTEALGVCA